MADVPKLLDAAIQAYQAGARDLAAEFTARALKALRPGREKATNELPWSSTPQDPRFPEWQRRAREFLRAFSDAYGDRLPKLEARELARRIFPEQPRVVGPSFYRSGYVESAKLRGDDVVRLTKMGREFLESLERSLSNGT